MNGLTKIARLRPIPYVFFVLVLCVVMLSGCGKAKEKGVPLTTPEGVALTAPLTGLPITNGDLLKRPLITVKIDNAPDARPQFGIENADVIIEEKVEGGVSRFMALFHSQDAERVGPVRSLRDTDVSWLAAEGGLLAYSGGIPQVRARINGTGITDVGADTFGEKYYKRRKDRSFEHSMFTNTKLLRDDLAPKNAKPPKSLYTYLANNQAFGGAGEVQITSFDARLANLPTAMSFVWTWDASKQTFMRKTDNKIHDIEGHGQIAMPNVVLQFTPYVKTQWTDRAKTPVDQANVIGEGEAWVFSGGKLVKGRWSRPNGDAITTFKDTSGTPIKLKAGQTWLTLVPTGTQVNLH